MTRLDLQLLESCVGSEKKEKREINLVDKTRENNNNQVNSSHEKNKK